MAQGRTNIRAGLLADPTVSGIVGTRIFYRKPLSEPTEAYILFIRAARARDDVTKDRRFRFECFSKTYDELDALSDAVIDYLHERTDIEGESYYKIRFINGSDVVDQLASGFYWNLLDFEFKFSF